MKKQSTRTLARNEYFAAERRRVYRRSANRISQPVDTHRCTPVHFQRWSREVLHVECALVPYYWHIRGDVHNCKRGWYCPLINGELNCRTTADKSWMDFFPVIKKTKTDFRLNSALLITYRMPNITGGPKRAITLTQTFLPFNPNNLVLD